MKKIVMIGLLATCGVRGAELPSVPPPPLQYTILPQDFAHW